MRSDEKRRLRLNRETLRVLDRDALARVAGGDGPGIESDVGTTVDCIDKCPKSNGWSRADAPLGICTTVKG